MVEIRKKALKRFILFSVVILSVKIINNWYATTTINWTYLKYNNKLYVLCEPGNAAIVNEAKPTLKKIGEVEREIPIFLHQPIIKFQMDCQKELKCTHLKIGK